MAMLDNSGTAVVKYKYYLGKREQYKLAPKAELYTYYQDDSAINGSIGWQTYLGSAMIGGAIGFGIGYFGPAISSFLGSSFTFTLPSLGSLNAGGALALAGSTAITITGAQIAGGAAALGLGILLFQQQH